jgi:hypothetical protein
MRKPRPSYRHQRSGGKIIYYRRTAAFWADVLALIEPVLVAWPPGRIKEELIELFHSAANTDALEQLVPADRHLSPADIAEKLILAALNQAHLEK